MISNGWAIVVAIFLILIALMVADPIMVFVGVTTSMAAGFLVSYLRHDMSIKLWDLVPNYIS